jgi:hypothetical protein
MASSTRQAVNSVFSKTAPVFLAQSELLPAKTRERRQSCAHRSFSFPMFLPRSRVRFLAVEIVHARLEGVRRRLQIGIAQVHPCRARRANRKQSGQRNLPPASLFAAAGHIDRPRRRWPSHFAANQKRGGPQGQESCNDYLFHDGISKQLELPAGKASLPALQRLNTSVVHHGLKSLATAI